MAIFKNVVSVILNYSLYKKVNKSQLYFTLNCRHLCCCSLYFDGCVLLRPDAPPRLSLFLFHTVHAGVTSQHFN